MAVPAPDCSVRVRTLLIVRCTLLFVMEDLYRDDQVSVTTVGALSVLSAGTPSE